MNIEELMKKSEYFSSMFSQKEAIDYLSIEDYVLSTLGTEKNCIENPEIFVKNFIHLLCHLCINVIYFSPSMG